MFSIHTTRENFKTQLPFWSCEPQAGESHDWLVSSTAVFWDVTQCSPKEGGALRDIPKNGCEGTNECRDVSVFKKLHFRNLFLVQRKVDVLGLKSVFVTKSVHGRPNTKTKATFQIAPE